MELDEKAMKKAWKEDTSELMQELLTVINDIDLFEKDIVQNTVKNWITTKEIGFGKVMMPLRLALVGALKGPDVFDIMFMIGKNESLQRIYNLINTLD